jgi:hypothetical protein
MMYPGVATGAQRDQEFHPVPSGAVMHDNPSRGATTLATAAISLDDPVPVAAETPMVVPFARVAAVAPASLLSYGATETESIKKRDLNHLRYSTGSSPYVLPAPHVSKS